MRPLEAGDYVLATQWHYGHPGDPWYVGFYAWSEAARHYVVDWFGDLQPRSWYRVQRISPERGLWLIEHTDLVSQSCRSLWWWYRASQATLSEAHTAFPKLFKPVAKDVFPSHSRPADCA